jgi:hypothetical protein
MVVTSSRLHAVKYKQAFDKYIAEQDHCRIQQLSEGAISLSKEGEEVVHGPTDVGAGRQNDMKAPLSEIIELLNARFSTDLKPEDQLTIDQFIADAKADAEICKRAHANAFDNFARRCLSYGHQLPTSWIARLVSAAASTPPRVWITAGIAWRIAYASARVDAARAVLVLFQGE